MALANFFDKAALAASTILRGFDAVAFESALNMQAVAVAFDGDAVASPEGRLTTELSANLIARLYPRVVFLPLGGNAESFLPRLEALVRSINPDINIESGPGEVSVCLSVGCTPVPIKVPTIYVGSHGWVVRLSTSGPVGSGDTPLPLGAGAAACFGAANLFRYVFREQLPEGTGDTALSLSLFDYTANAPDPADPLLSPIVDFGPVQFVGLGAIGQGAMWALRHTAGLRGELHLVDGEAVDLSNLQRYVLTTQDDVTPPKAKVAIALRALRDCGLDVRPYEMRWGEYLQTRSDWQLERVAVAVDSAEDRIAVQAALPHWVVNAWTQPGNLGISRHTFLGEAACLACLYLPQGKVKNQDELVAEAIGLPGEILKVRQLLHTGEAIGRPFLDRIAEALGVPVDELLDFESKPLRAFYTEALCGGIVLRLGGGTAKTAFVEVPMVFQSALAGIMLAAELLANAAGLKRVPPPVTTRLNLLRPLGEYLSLDEKKRPDGRCLCQDPDFIRQYKEKYGPGENDGRNW